MSEHRDPRIDAYIAKAAPFAQPILQHLRELVRRGCPGAVETLKWSAPAFEYGGRILCSMAAFKAHCAFGFWHQGMQKVIGDFGAKSETAMGSFGRITRRADLPGDKRMIRFIKAAAQLNESGTPARPKPVVSSATVELRVPPDLAKALQGNRAAAENFRNFRPSHRKEYIEWIVSAKREATREKRLATTLEWLTNGKPRHWKYQK
jgi:uncharacterized protein YdeI (YjbR/CyaY-like superfamily)